jgi:hypothetical protein
VTDVTTPATIATVTQNEPQSPKTRADAIAVRVYSTAAAVHKYAAPESQAVIVTDVTTPATIATVTQNEHQSPKTRADAIAVRVYCSSDTRCYYIAGCHRDRRHPTCDHRDGDSE